MKNILLAIVSITMVSNFWAQVIYPCPANGNAESDNFTNWTTMTGASQNPQPLNGFTPTLGVNDFAVLDNTDVWSPGIPPYTNQVNMGTDLYGQFPIPSQGTYCFSVGSSRIGNTNGGFANLMKYSFTVNNQNKHFKMRYAMVLNEGSHPAGNDPMVWFYMVKGNTHLPSFSSMGLYMNTIQYVEADPNNPYFQRSPNFPQDIMYRDWECLEFDLSSYVGQEVTFVAISRDCTPGGHFGYVYIDGLCNSWPSVAQGTLNGTEFCMEQTIFLDGAASENEDSYSIQVTQVDANNNPVPGGMNIFEDFVGQSVPDDINISQLITSNGGKLKCGLRYRVKLKARNHCSQENERNLYFTIVCPQIDAGEDVVQCCQGVGLQEDFQIGSAAIPGNTYSWVSIPSGFTSNSAIVTVDPTVNTGYIVTMTQPNGCIARDTVIFSFVPASYEVTITTDYVLCDPKPIATAQLEREGCPEINDDFFDAFGYPESASILWFFDPETGPSYFLGTGTSISVPNQNGSVSATVSNGCSQVQATGSIEIEYRPMGHDLIAPNAMTPDGSEFNNVFRVLEYNLDAPDIGEGPAYGIEDFKLRIWNRWGENFVTTTKADAGRGPEDYLRQGDIMWDGTNAQGIIVQDGVYPYTLEVKYCGDTDFTPVCLPNMQENPCVRWAWLFCTQRIEGCVGMITVVQ